MGRNKNLQLNKDFANLALNGEFFKLPNAVCKTKFMTLDAKGHMSHQYFNLF